MSDERNYVELSYDGRLFRRTFGVPRKVFDFLLSEVQKVDALKDKGEGAGRGQTRAPAALQLMAALYRLRKACDTHTLFWLTRLGVSTLHRWFHAFVEHFADGPVFKEWVHAAATDAELAEDMHVYEKMGFPGAFCSQDGVHLIWEKCPSKQCAMHKREGFPSLGFNVTVNHAKRIRAVAGAYPGTRNDKTLAYHDQFTIGLRTGAMRLRGGRAVRDVPYDLYSVDGSVQRLKGPWIVCDGGYHRWRVYQGPLKFSSDKNKLRWTKRLESVRKDVECTFGILKKRFRVLKTPLTFMTASTVSHVMRTCCVLHNILLEHDGLATIGQEEGDWLQADLDADEVRVYREREAELLRRYSAVVPARDVTREDRREVREWAMLREQLMVHFTYVRNRRRLLWPKPAAQGRDPVRAHILPREEPASDEEHEECDSYEEEFEERESDEESGSAMSAGDDGV